MVTGVRGLAAIDGVALALRHALLLGAVVHETAHSAGHLHLGVALHDVEVLRNGLGGVGARRGNGNRSRARLHVVAVSNLVVREVLDLGPAVAGAGVRLHGDLGLDLGSGPSLVVDGLGRYLERNVLRNNCEGLRERSLVVALEGDNRRRSAGLDVVREDHVVVLALDELDVVSVVRVAPVVLDGDRRGDGFTRVGLVGNVVHGEVGVVGLVDGELRARGADVVAIADDGYRRKSDIGVVAVINVVIPLVHELPVERHPGCRRNLPAGVRLVRFSRTESDDRRGDVLVRDDPRDLNRVVALVKRRTVGHGLGPLVTVLEREDRSVRLVLVARVGRGIELNGIALTLRHARLLGAVVYEARDRGRDHNDVVVRGLQRYVGRYGLGEVVGTLVVGVHPSAERHAGLRRVGGLCGLVRAGHALLVDGLRCAAVRVERDDAALDHGVGAVLGGRRACSGNCDVARLDRARCVGVVAELRVVALEGAARDVDELVLAVGLVHGEALEAVLVCVRLISLVHVGAGGDVYGAARERIDARAVLAVDHHLEVVVVQVERAAVAHGNEVGAVALLNGALCAVSRLLYAGAVDGTVLELERAGLHVERAAVVRGALRLDGVATEVDGEVLVGIDALRERDVLEQLDGVAVLSRLDGAGERVVVLVAHLCNGVGDGKRAGDNTRVVALERGYHGCRAGVHVVAVGEVVVGARNELPVEDFPATDGIDVSGDTLGLGVAHVIYGNHIRHDGATGVRLRRGLDDHLDVVCGAVLLVDGEVRGLLASIVALAGDGSLGDADLDVVLIHDVVVSALDERLGVIARTVLHYDGLNLATGVGLARDGRDVERGDVLREDGEGALLAGGVVAALLADARDVYVVRADAVALGAPERGLDEVAVERARLGEGELGVLLAVHLGLVVGLDGDGRLADVPLDLLHGLVVREAVIGVGRDARRPGAPLPLDVARDGVALALGHAGLVLVLALVDKTFNSLRHLDCLLRDGPLDGDVVELLAFLGVSPHVAFLNLGCGGVSVRVGGLYSTGERVALGVLGLDDARLLGAVVDKVVSCGGSRGRHVVGQAVQTIVVLLEILALGQLDLLVGIALAVGEGSAGDGDLALLRCGLGLVRLDGTGVGGNHLATGDGGLGGLVGGRGVSAVVDDDGVAGRVGAAAVVAGLRIRAGGDNLAAGHVHGAGLGVDGRGAGNLATTHGERIGRGLVDGDLVHRGHLASGDVDGGAGGVRAVGGDGGVVGGGDGAGLHVERGAAAEEGDAPLAGRDGRAVDGDVVGAVGPDGVALIGVVDYLAAVEVDRIGAGRVDGKLLDVGAGLYGARLQRERGAVLKVHRDVGHDLAVLVNGAVLNGEVACDRVEQRVAVRAAHRLAVEVNRDGLLDLDVALLLAVGDHLDGVAVLRGRNGVGERGEVVVVDARDALGGLVRRLIGGVARHVRDLGIPAGKRVGAIGIGGLRRVGRLLDVGRLGAVLDVLVLLEHGVAVLVHEGDGVLVRGPGRLELDVGGDGSLGEVVLSAVQRPLAEGVAFLGRFSGRGSHLVVLDLLALDRNAAVGVERDGVLIRLPAGREGGVLGKGLVEVVFRAHVEPAIEGVAGLGGVDGPSRLGHGLALRDRSDDVLLGVVNLAAIQVERDLDGRHDVIITVERGNRRAELVRDDVLGLDVGAIGTTLDHNVALGRVEHRKFFRSDLRVAGHRNLTGTVLLNAIIGGVDGHVVNHHVTTREGEDARSVPVTTHRSVAYAANLGIRDSARRFVRYLDALLEVIELVSRFVRSVAHNGAVLDVEGAALEAHRVTVELVERHVIERELAGVGGLGAHGRGLGVDVVAVAELRHPEVLDRDVATTSEVEAAVIHRVGCVVARTLHRVAVTVDGNAPRVGNLNTVVREA